MGERPLWQALQADYQEGALGFHTPGHGRGRALAGLGIHLDTTESPGLDDLHAPEGVIAHAQRLAARAFGAGATFFLVQGATVGIHALCLAGLRPGDRLALPRHSHRSVFGGLVLSGAVPRYLPPLCEKETGLPLAVDPSGLEAAAEGAAALLALRPSYWGTAEDLSPWRQAAERQGAALWVDEAHGAAYVFSSQLPDAALRLGAHAVVHGSHKTLPALTQAAMLHINAGAAVQEVARALALLQTTSPSYLLMASLDEARRRMEEEGEMLWHKTVERAQRLRKDLNHLKGVFCWGEEIINYPAVSGWDPTRLLVVLRGAMPSGYAARKWLRRVHGIEAELAGPNYLLFLLSPFDPPDADARLRAAFRDLSLEAAYGAVAKPNRISAFASGPLLKAAYSSCPERVLSPREAFHAPRRRVSWPEARGRLAAEFICPYPPGIPLVAPGERITADIAETVEALRRAGAQWQGAADPGLCELFIIDE
ncbi:arginine decarboxylase [Heliomicrobium modesticaldum Ice1]|uniref:Arginine decarboxylase n=1 Tax=Heliobacterium modesticaldum (strain ATCC 51547 / Ice1) TaxID=498761 RepID=B0TB68_HELMI|nr:arginine decarboxylase [Heliomicrobium modesticaldum]ABZ83795.1 arginine decarboxylase [Heliomicrobium modesticaldum Ice1]